jgi:hypothetical protein
MTLRTARWSLTQLTLLCAPAFAWNAEGHHVIGSIADQLLNDRAKREVARLLGTDLRTASTWPDCARSVELRNGTFVYVINPRFADVTSRHRAGKPESHGLDDHEH